ncbi:hypothetical protein ACFQ2B_31180 [Streptomyces stramineus]|uniref:Uncharacterized protein n=1 Tax=Streptomyces stramineus TaxID=173861 RepID=A0ABP3K7X7_9ACTN
MRSWCTDHHVDYLDMWEPLRDNNDLLVDGLPPIPEGHQALYQHLNVLGR